MIDSLLAVLCLIVIGSAMRPRRTALRHAGTAVLVILVTAVATNLRETHRRLGPRRLALAHMTLTPLYRTSRSPRTRGAGGPHHRHPLPHRSPAVPAG